MLLGTALSYQAHCELAYGRGDRMEEWREGGREI